MTVGPYRAALRPPLSLGLSYLIFAPTLLVTQRSPVGEGQGEGQRMSNADGSPLPVGEGRVEGYADVPGFCKSATLEEIRKHGHVLTPGRYVGAAPQEDDGEPFAEKMARLAAQWREQQAEAQRLDAEIEENLKNLGFG